MKVRSITLTLACLAIASAVSIEDRNVFNFEIKTKGRQIISPQDFSFKDCGGKIAHAYSLSVTPDPLQFPGTATLSFNATLSAELKSPLQLSLTLEKEVVGKYIKIPCVDNFGSCVYPDLCQILEPINPCPDELQKAGIPCQCPYKAGNYVLPSIGIEEDGFPLPSGGYHVQFNLTSSGELAGCMDVYLSVAS